MIESIKLLIAVIVGVMEALPQTDAGGKIPDAEYNTLVVGAVTGAITGAGFLVDGLPTSRSLALLLLLSAWFVRIRRLLAWLRKLF